MRKCFCIVASGPHKGSQCSNQAKSGSKFCGVHKNCIMDLTRQPSQARQSPLARQPPQVHESAETFPDQLRPIDGQCPQKFPNQRQLPNGSLCCWRKFKTIRKMRQRKSSRSSADLKIIPAVPCLLDDWIQYYPETELVPARRVDISGSDCKSYNQALMMELPSPDWIHEKRLYLARLDPSDRDLLSFYTFHGDVILNNFARHRWSMTEDDLDYLRVNYRGPVPQLFENVMASLRLTETDSVEQVLMELSNRLNQIIMGSPINPQRFVAYRGSQTKDYFESPTGATKQIFQNVGFFS